MERVCTRCGETVRAGDRFCGRCGQPLAEPEAQAAPRRPLGWLLAAMPVVALLAALALTNPSPDAYAGWLAGRLLTVRPQVAGATTVDVLAAAIGRATIAQNDIVFTVFDTSLRGVRVDVLGILGHFVSLGAGPAG
jgi:hypothetical protein